MMKACPHGMMTGSVFECYQCKQNKTPGPFANFLHILAAGSAVATNEFLSAVRSELGRARRKHTTPLHSHHEAYAVVLEELQEVWDEVRKQEADPERIRAELTQVAAMCARWAEDVCGKGQA